MGILEGKVAIVTGGSSGIGAAAAVQFAKEGAKVAIAARRAEQSARVVRQIEALGGEAIFIKTDVIHAPDIEAMVVKTVERFGRLDCAFNNAGIGGPAGVPVAEIIESSWDQVMNINLKSEWLSMKYEIPAMLERGKGAIVNNSSVYGYKPSDVAHAAYATSKFGVIGLSKSAAVDYAQKGIRINVVSPGYVHSELVDPYVEAVPDVMKALVSRYSAMNRLGEGHEIAAGVAWLCSDAASFVNGAVLAMDGGDTTRLY